MHVEDLLAPKFSHNVANTQKMNSVDIQIYYGDEFQKKWPRLISETPHHETCFPSTINFEYPFFFLFILYKKDRCVRTDNQFSLYNNFEYPF